MTNFRPLKVAMLIVDSSEVVEEHRVRPGSQSPQAHPVIHTLLEAMALCEDIEVHALYGDRTATKVVTRREGAVLYTAIPVSRRRLPVPMAGYWLRYAALRRHLQQLKPDLVHAQGTERESGMVAAHSGFPNVITMHGNFREIQKVFNDPMLSYHWINARLETHVLKRIEHIICISRYVEAITRPFPAAKTVIPNAVRQEFLAVARPDRSAVPRVVCMGTIDARKRTRDILAACEMLWARGVRFTFHVYGGVGFGPGYGQAFLRDLQPFIERGMARFEGHHWRPWEELAQADVMVSASCEESFGMNMLEAMACGTPCVGPATGGIRDIIDEGVTGWLYPAGNIEACADAIERLLADGALWHSFSVAGRHRAQQGFSAAAVAERTVECYRKVISQSSFPARP